MKVGSANHQIQKYDEQSNVPLQKNGRFSHLISSLSDVLENINKAALPILLLGIVLQASQIVADNQGDKDGPWLDWAGYGNSLNR